MKSKYFRFVLVLVLFVLIGCQKNGKIISIIELDMNKDGVNECFFIKQINQNKCELIVKDKKDGRIIKNILFFRPSAELLPRDAESINIVFVRDSGNGGVLLYDGEDYLFKYTEDDPEL
jgi:hypothetical protein